MTDAAPDATTTSGESASARQILASSTWDAPVIAATVTVPLVAHCGEAPAQNLAPNEEHARHD
ncbi:hypothetical protein [Leucobacter komagatae]|uniref:hypothetical protein n=1 Tax=Leucobacter komagatae TaxID=55969 RepID=UPI00114D958A|nr:hypothetical protein [Leucobacter komagatae]